MPRFTPEVVEALRARRFPGNVRELQNLMRQVILSEGGTIPPGFLAEPAALEADTPGRSPEVFIQAGPIALRHGRAEPLAVIERRAIEAAIAARRQHLSCRRRPRPQPSTLYRKKLASGRAHPPVVSRL